MNRKALARNLAATLANTAWDQPAISAALRRRLPAFAHHLIPTLAADLVRDFPKLYAPPPAAIAAGLATLPAFGRLHTEATKNRVWPAPDLAGPTLHPAPAFRDLDLPHLATQADLAAWLLVTPERLAWFADRQGRAARNDEVALNHYFPQLIPKARGGFRLIEAPKPALKAIQRQILQGILTAVPSHPAAHGFVAGRSCQGAAAQHAGEAVVVSFDIRHFFHAVESSRIHALFRCLGYPHKVAQCLTGLVTTRTHPMIRERLTSTERRRLAHPHLPQGAPTSPALANLAAFTLDRRLSGLARRLGAHYTRYADDLTFSGDEAIAAPLLSVVPRILTDEGFAAHPGKTRVQKRSERQTVTGIVVNDHINIPRRDYDLLKATLHHLARAGDPRRSDPGFLESLSGRIGWVEQINPRRGAKLRARLEAIQKVIGGRAA